MHTHQGPEVGRALGTQTGAGITGVERQYHTDEQATVLAISGHNPETLADPQWRALFQRGVCWALKRF